MTADDLEQERAVLGRLAQAMRDLAEASLRTTVPADVVTDVVTDMVTDVVADVTNELERLTARLRQEHPGVFGVSLTSSGGVRGGGNAAVGTRSPITVPVRVTREARNRSDRADSRIRRVAGVASPVR